MMVQPERLSGWVRCLALCTFDIDVGQKCDKVFPRGALSPAEKKSIAYMAFPDSAGLPTDNYDACFGFRVKSPATEDYILGATFFRQQADRNNKRGFSQRAVVVVCDHDSSFACLMKQICYTLGPLYFENGEAVMETAWYLINSEWPNLRDIFSPSDDEDEDTLSRNASPQTLALVNGTTTPSGRPGTASRQDDDRGRGGGSSSSSTSSSSSESSSEPQSPLRDYNQAPLATSVHNTPAQPSASPLQLAPPPGLLGALVEHSGEGLSSGNGSSSPSRSPSRTRPPALEDLGYSSSSSPVGSRKNASGSAHDHIAGGTGSGSEPVGAVGRVESFVDNGLGMGLAQHHRMTAGAVAAVTGGTKPIPGSSPVETALVVGTGAAASSSRFLPPPVSANSSKPGTKDANQNIIVGEKVQFASVLLGNFEKRTLALRLFSSTLYITLIPAETVVRFLEFDPFDGKDPTLQTKSPLASAVMSIFGFGIGNSTNSKSSLNAGEASIISNKNVKKQNVQGRSPSVDKLVRQRSRSSSSLNASGEQSSPGQNSRSGSRSPGGPGSGSAGRKVPHGTMSLTNDALLTSSKSGSHSEDLGSARRNLANPKRSISLMAGGMSAEMSPKTRPLNVLEAFTSSLPLSRSSTKESGLGLSGGPGGTGGGDGGGDNKTSSEEDQDPTRELMALRGTFDASTLQFRDWVFPKWALCPTLESKESSSSGGITGIGGARMPSFLSNYLEMKSPVNDVRRTGVLSQLSSVTAQAGMVSADGNSSYQQGMPKLSPRTEGSGNEPSRANSSQRSLGQALSRALQIPVESSASSTDPEQENDVPISPRKHSVTYGGSSGELRALSKSLEAQSYDGAAWNLWTRLAEFGPEMLWTLWSLALTGDPLVIYGNSQIVDDAVYAFAQLVKPLEFRCDYRPRFTVYDSEFKDRKNMPTVCGCANPAIFGELTRETAPYYRAASSAGVDNGGSHGNSGGGGNSNRRTSESAVPRGVSGNTNTNYRTAALARANTTTVTGAAGSGGNNNMQRSNSVSTGSGINAQPSKVSSLILGALDANEQRVLEIKPGNFKEPKVLCKSSQLFTENSGPIAPDKELLNRLLPPTTHSSIMINNFILCQYFYELTCTFLKPFLRYLVANASVLMPSHKQGNGGLALRSRTASATGIMEQGGIYNANDNDGKMGGMDKQQQMSKETNKSGYTSGTGGLVSGDEGTSRGAEVSNLLKSSQLRHRQPGSKASVSNSQDGLHLLEIAESIEEVELSEKSTKDLEEMLESHYFRPALVSFAPMARATSTNSNGDAGSPPPAGSSSSASASGAGTAAPTKTRTLLPAFTSQEFFKHLEVEGVFKTAHPQKVKKLYLRFINSPHFEPWFRKQRDEVVREALRIVKAARLSKQEVTTQ